jgi:multidrug efflux pump
MRISDICIKRPVFATVLSLMMLLIGVVAYDRLSVREYPNVEEPVVSVSTSYPGASAEIIESQITQVLEGSIAGISGIDTLESTSRTEQSRITVRFRIDVDPDVAASDVRDRVSRVRQRLPDEVDEPTVAKVEDDAQPVMFLALTSATQSPLEISDLVDRTITDRLKNLNGVADVQIYGERRYAMRIWIDRERLGAYSLTVQDVENALRQQNAEIPSGRIESLDREFNVLSRTGLATPEEFGNIVLKVAQGYPVRLKDVARVEIGAADERRVSRFNGQNSVTIGIIKQATANPLEVSKAVMDELPRITETLPKEMRIAVANDTTVFIARSISAVYATIFEAVIFVVLVIFFFLRSVRASIIPVVTIPVSLITTFALMYVFGFTINTLTLLAMVLAIGLVVDDAIVVLENVYRYIEEGMQPVEAAIKGTREIGFAVIAMTLTLAAVYAPIAFAEGRTGRLFLEFALTLAGAVLVSGFVALTLTPMMCSKLLRHQERHGRLYMALEKGFNTVAIRYRNGMSRVIARPFVVIAGAGAVALSSVFLFMALPNELTPTEDRAQLRLFGTGPEGATIGYTSRYGTQVEEALRGVEGVNAQLVIAGVPQTINLLGYARLDDWDIRTRPQQDIQAELQKKFARIPGMMVFASNPPSFGRGGGLGSKPVNFIVQTSGTYEDLRDMTDKLLERLRDYNGLQNIESDLVLNKPEFQVKIDRPKVADLGLDVSVVGRTLETLLGGRQVTRFERDGEQYDVMVQLAAAERATPDVLSSLYVRGTNDTMVQMSNIISVSESVAPRDLRRFNQMRAATLSATLAPGVSLGEALNVVSAAAREVLPDTAVTDYGGQSREFAESSQSLVLVFVLALAFIYLVLAAQFESFIDPLIILLTVPLSITGALAALYLAGGSLNVYSQIGLVTLVGLITKHGILIVEFANQKQDEGMSVVDAVMEAAVQRLRPILMTTGAMVLGALPLALASGAGAESRSQIGWVIVGGMTFGTLLTLFVVPTVYALIELKFKTHGGEQSIRRLTV